MGQRKQPKERKDKTGTGNLCMKHRKCAYCPPKAKSAQSWTVISNGRVTQYWSFRKPVFWLLFFAPDLFPLSSLCQVSTCTNLLLHSALWQQKPATAQWSYLLHRTSVRLARTQWLILVVSTNEETLFCWCSYIYTLIPSFEPAVKGFTRKTILSCERL